MTRTVTGRLAGTAAALVLAAGTALVAAVPASAAPIISIGYDVQVRAVHSGKCLEVADWRTDNGAPVRQWTCTGGANQKWHFNPDGTVLNAHSGKCLEVPGWNRERGVQVGQWDCHGGYNQKWEGMNAMPDLGSMSVWSSYAALPIDIRSASTADGAPAVLWPAGGPGYNQQFSFEG
ncbi:RICIN domain-containing protein [Kitasatospora sp. NPDC056327]|uniref:RICIN domain-containing protein n=1 Tax=Kitasatospora sp. NPDC056327 TaxID=3345785 RepID=UPI0035DBF32D